MEMEYHEDKPVFGGQAHRGNHSMHHPCPEHGEGKVHQTLGPGFIESVYRRALLIELRSCYLTAETEKEVVVYYKGEEVSRHRLDILVESKVLVN